MQGWMAGWMDAVRRWLSASASSRFIPADTLIALLIPGWAAPEAKSDTGMK